MALMHIKLGVLEIQKVENHCINQRPSPMRNASQTAHTTTHQQRNDSAPILHEVSKYLPTTLCNRGLCAPESLQSEN